MLNYWKADVFRTVRSLSFWILIAVAPLIYLAGVFMVSGPHYSLSTHATIVTMVGVLAAIFAGIGIYNTVYSQDIKAGAMHVAIGRGTARTRVVIAKFVEVLVLSVLVGALLYVFERFVPMVFGIPQNGKLNAALLASVLQFVLQTVIFASLASIVSMARQESVTATVIYVLLAAGVVDQLIGLLLSLNVVKSVVGNLTGYLPQALANSLGAQLSGISGSVSISLVLVYIGYIVVAQVLASWVFNRKELEF